MVDLATELETKLFDIVEEQQAKAEQALKSLKEVSKFLEDNGKEGFWDWRPNPVLQAGVKQNPAKDLEYIESLIDTMGSSNWHTEIVAIYKTFDEQQETK